MVFNAKLVFIVLKDPKIYQMYAQEAIIAQLIQVLKRPVMLENIVRNKSSQLFLGIALLGIFVMQEPMLMEDQK